MILHLDVHGQVSLAEPSDFRRLHCEFALPAARHDHAAFLLRGIAQLEQDGAWIELAWMRTQAPPGDASWLHAFEQMIAQARPHGWVSADGLRVKAHVMWTAPDLSGPAILETRTLT
ncbi:hypothetical protein ACO2Q9_11420 [Variovorax sp. VNK109]|uniref:hypothetical protein n=1 Tax=Variovorax sp. VNK109 TaxID=3400919 RepID=UPI003C10666F